MGRVGAFFSILPKRVCPKMTSFGSTLESFGGKTFASPSKGPKIHKGLQKPRCDNAHHVAEFVDQTLTTAPCGSPNLDRQQLNCRGLKLCFHSEPPERGDRSNGRPQLTRPAVCCASPARASRRRVGYQTTGALKDGVEWEGAIRDMARAMKKSSDFPKTQ